MFLTVRFVISSNRDSLSRSGTSLFFSAAALQTSCRNRPMCRIYRNKRIDSEADCSVHIDASAMKSCTPRVGNICKLDSTLPGLSDRQQMCSEFVNLVQHLGGAVACAGIELSLVRVRIEVQKRCQR